MVNCRLRPSGNRPVCIGCLYDYSAREFVGKQQRSLAYVDEDLPLSGRCLMNQGTACLLQALIKPDDNILIVGAGCGYGRRLRQIGRVSDCH